MAKVLSPIESSDEVCAARPGDLLIEVNSCGLFKVGIGGDIDLDIGAGLRLSHGRWFDLQRASFCLYLPPFEVCTTLTIDPVRLNGLSPVIHDGVEGDRSDPMLVTMSEPRGLYCSSRGLLYTVRRQIQDDQWGPGHGKRLHGIVVVPHY